MLIRKHGVTYHDKAKATPGFTLHTRNFADQISLIDMDGNVVWKYINPFYGPHPVMPGNMNWVFHAKRYAADSPEIQSDL